MSLCNCKEKNIIFIMKKVQSSQPFAIRPLLNELNLEQEQHVNRSTFTEEKAKIISDSVRCSIIEISKN